MKKPIFTLMFIAMLLTTFAAHADNFKSEAFVNKSMELLLKNPESLNYKNKAITAEQSRRVFLEFQNFATELLFGGEGDRLENPSGPIKDFSAMCTSVSPQALVARCELALHYKDSSTVSISFLVKVDLAVAPQLIVENTVDINVINQ